MAHRVLSLYKTMNNYYLHNSDGYDELPPEYQEALRERHPHGDRDEDVHETATIAKPTTIVLTPEQDEAVHRIERFIARPDIKEFKLGGYAGTGKTTIIRTVKERLQERYGVVVTAFTGKAVNVLQRKGIRAQTLHSLMYECEKIKGVLHWHKRDCLPDGIDKIIVDEASMISTELYKDLVSYGKQILWVGDPGQLEPVGDNPNLMAQPDYVLSKIHRQAEKSPIIALANAIRQGGELPWLQETDELSVRLKLSMDISGVTQMICAKNKTRRSINDYYRRLANMAYHEVVQGEKIIVLKNNKSQGVFNGMLLFVQAVTKDVPMSLNVAPHYILDAVDEAGNRFSDLIVWKFPFTTENEMPKNVDVPRIKVDNDRIEMVYADYGYCITCHKSQGSEWDTVLVYDEWMPSRIWDMKRWRYTAITRAAKRLIYCRDA